MKYVEEWIKDEIEYNNKMYEQAPIERAKIRQEAEERAKKDLIEKGKELKELAISLKVLNDSKYQYELKRWKYWLNYRQYGEKVAKEKMEKDVKNHFEELQNKVEKKIGKIIKIEKVNGNIYSFVGELDNCNVEVILAGGYNIQRLHTRWIITKNLDR